MIGSIYSLQFDITGDMAAGIETLNGEVNHDFVINRVVWIVSLDAGEMPTGQDAVLDILLSRDHGATWASIFPPGGEIHITAGGTNWGEVTSFALTDVRAGDWGKVQCVQAGSIIPGCGVQVNVHGSRA